MTTSPSATVSPAPRSNTPCTSPVPARFADARVLRVADVGRVVLYRMKVSVPVAVGPRNPKKSILRRTEPTGMRNEACIELPLSL